MDAVNTQIEELLNIITDLIVEVESIEEEIAYRRVGLKVLREENEVDAVNTQIEELLKDVESLEEEIELRKVGLNVLRFDRLALWFFRFGSRHVHEVNTLLTDAEIMMDDIAIVIRAKHHV